jgi:hypothetical protein
MRLHPFDECLMAADEVIRKGGTVYQQFNCSSCGTKQTMDDANVFHKLGRCEECEAITDIKHEGCNYMVVFR